MENENLKLTGKELDDCNKIFNSDPSKEGKIKKFSEAKVYLDSFLSEDALVVTSGEIYGFTFGLEVFTTYMKLIKTHNGDASKKKIHGLRMYYAKSLRGAPKKYCRDLIIVPVDKDNIDIEEIHIRKDGKADFPSKDQPKFNDDEMVLSESRPCPNQCKK